MTVEENIAFPLREAGMRDVKAMRTRVNEVLEVVELEGENAKMPESLSGGMRNVSAWLGPLSASLHACFMTSLPPGSIR